MFYRFKDIHLTHKLFQAFENLRGVEQRTDHHPEKDAFNHSVQVLNMALRESDDVDLIMAAMLHDVGKITHTIGHEQYAITMLKGAISEKTEWLINQHIRINWFLNGQMKKKAKILYLYTHKWFADLILLHRWDKAGRNPNYVVRYDRVTIIDRLIKLNGECTE